MTVLPLLLPRAACLMEIIEWIMSCLSACLSPTPACLSVPESFLRKGAAAIIIYIFFFSFFQPGSRHGGVAW